MIEFNIPLIYVNDNLILNSLMISDTYIPKLMILVISKMITTPYLPNAFFKELSKLIIFSLS